MPKPRNPFALGITVIAMFVLFVAVLLTLARTDFREKDLFVVRFSEHGVLPELKQGGQIRCGPRVVGKIVGIEIREEAPDEGTPASPRLYFDVTASVDREIGLRTDCRIVAEGPILGGAGWLVIKDRGVGETRVDRDTIIDGKPAEGFAAIFEVLAAQLDEDKPGSLLSQIKTQLDPENAVSLISKLHTSMDDLNVVTARVSAQLDPDQKTALLAKLHAIMDNVNLATGYLKNQLDSGRDAALIGKLHTGLDTLNEGLRTAADLLRENSEPISQTITSVRNTARTFETGVAQRIADQLDTENAASLLAKIHIGIDRLNQSMADINEISGTGREVLTLNADRVNKMLANFKETSDHLKGAAKDVRRNPWRLLYRPTLEETRQLDIFDAARAFAEAATQLDDAVMQLNALARAQSGRLSSDDPQLLEIRERLSGTFEKFSKAENALWAQLNLDQ